MCALTQTKMEWGVKMAIKITKKDKSQLADFALNYIEKPEFRQAVHSIVKVGVLEWLKQVRDKNQEEDK